MNVHRVAVVQTSSIPGDPKGTTEKLIEFCNVAKAKGAELVLFPEAFVGGYPKGADFRIFLGGRTPEGREEFRLYAESAIVVPGPETDRIAEVAGALKLFLVVGVVERSGGTLYCSVLFFGPQGVLLGKHRKIMTTALERLIWGVGDGSLLPTFKSMLGTVGAVICWENYMPLLRMAMFGKGIEIYCAPTADDRPTWAASMQHIALEGRCFVLSACQHMRGKDFPAGFHNTLDPKSDTVLMRGGSCIVSPLGQLLAGPEYDQDTVLLAEIDLDDLIRAKMDFDVVGHYGRPDIFGLTVDDRPKPPVSSVLAPAGST